MKKNTVITSDGIRKVLKNYNPAAAFAEYIWNGYDAKATDIEILYSANEIGRIDELSVSDNGTGINFADLGEKFEKFYDSQKTISIKSPKHTSILHGKNGVGRLTFFCFANHAEWEIVYSDEKGVMHGGRIAIDASALQTYNTFDEAPFGYFSGTKVSFKNLVILSPVFENDIINYIIKEFGWYLELNKNKSLKNKW